MKHYIDDNRGQWMNTLTDGIINAIFDTYTKTSMNQIDPIDESDV